MRLRSLILAVVMSGVLFGHVRESHAITSCNVCADNQHPCIFKCYTGSFDFPFVTTCGQAGYRCLRIPLANAGEQCALPAAPATAAPATVVAGWLRGGVAFVNHVVLSAAR